MLTKRRVIISVPSVLHNYQAGLGKALVSLSNSECLWSDSPRPPRQALARRTLVWGEVKQTDRTSEQRHAASEEEGKGNWRLASGDFGSPGCHRRKTRGCFVPRLGSERKRSMPWDRCELGHPG